METSPDAARWLSEEEQRTWRRWLAVQGRFPAALGRDLQTTSNLSLSDFDVLVQLTETPGHRLRVLDLARTLTWERSRVSHHVSRMERRGLVAREECEDDGRGWWVVLTDDGRAALDSAAPGHVATVRRLLVDALGPERLAALDDALVTILERLDAEPGSPR